MAKATYPPRGRGRDAAVLAGGRAGEGHGSGTTVVDVRPRPFVPDHVSAAPGLAAPVLAHAVLADGDWAVATRSGLHLLLGGAALSRRWTDVDGAALDAEGVLEVRWVDGTAPVRLNPPARSRLPRVVHERVQSSVVLAEQVPVPGDRRLRVALRKDPDGSLFTQVIGNGQVDLDDPQVARSVDEAEARIRDAAGL